MRKGGERFQYQSVVDRYHLRPEYPTEIHNKLYEFVTPDSHVLDIGCGPGKLSYPLSERVASVLAVDLSEAMIELAQSDARDDSNIDWRVADIHTLEFPNNVDLIVAGASIHWTNLDVLLPRLHDVLNGNGKIVFIEGDEGVGHPWGEAELELMKQVQIEINEVTPRWAIEAKFSGRQKTAIVKHDAFVREDSMQVKHEFSATIDHYINITHSRQSFALDCMPESVAEQFYRDMVALVTPYATDGVLTYEVGTLMEWGTIKKGDGGI